MASRKQTEAARQNIKKAQQVWQEMTSREHALAQPQGKAREKPGESGQGNYFRIVVRDSDQFSTFRYHDMGSYGHIQRLAGKRSSGSWDTQAWLISKQDAHLEGDELIADSDDARDLLDTLGSKPKHLKGDIFEAQDRPNIPEEEKPTRAQQRARMSNIKKAQQARWQVVAHQIRKKLKKERDLYS